jgi:hypothetical protein
LPILTRLKLFLTSKCTVGVASCPVQINYVVSKSPHIMIMYLSGLDINVCPIPEKTDVGQVDLVFRLSDGTSEKVRFPNLLVQVKTDKSISTGIKYWVCWIPNLSIIYFESLYLHGIDDLTTVLKCF